MEESIYFGDCCTGGGEDLNEALSLAVAMDKYKEVWMLVQMGADVTYRDKLGMSVIELANEAMKRMLRLVYRVQWYLTLGPYLPDALIKEWLTKNEIN